MRVPPTGGMASVTSIGWASAAQRKPQHGRIDVDAVDDHTEPDGIGRFERRCDRARLAAGERAHGVEQMREAGQAFRASPRGSARRSPSNGRARRTRRQRTSSPMKPAGTCSGASVTSVTPCPSRVIIVRSLRIGRGATRADCARRPFRRQKRSFEVNAEHARLVAMRCRDRSDRCWRIFSGVSVISVGSSAVVPNRRCAARDRRNAVRRRLVVEQHVAAAVHLHVDEAGREPGAGPAASRTGSPARQVGARHDRDDRRCLRSRRRCRGAVPSPSNTGSPRRRARRGSSRAGDLLQVARLVDIDAAPGRETHQERRRSSGSGRRRRSRGDHARAPAVAEPSACAANTRAPFGGGLPRVSGKAGGSRVRRQEHQDRKPASRPAPSGPCRNSAPLNASAWRLQVSLSLSAASRAIASVGPRPIVTRLSEARAGPSAALQSSVRGRREPVRHPRRSLR